MHLNNIFFILNYPKIRKVTPTIIKIDKISGKIVNLKLFAK